MFAARQQFHFHVPYTQKTNFYFQFPLEDCSKHGIPSILLHLDFFKHKKTIFSFRRLFDLRSCFQF